MQESKAKSAAFLSLTALVVIASAAAVAYSVPYAHAAARSEAANLVGESASATQAEKLANYQLAVWLDPASNKAKYGLARAQLAAWQPEEALATLKKAGEGSEADELRLRTDIELSRIDPAAGLTALIGRQGSPEAAQRLARAHMGKLALAAELYASGLPTSSSALLAKLPVTFERNVLLGRLNFDRHTTTSLETASSYIKAAIALNPSNIPARRLYAAVLRDQNLPDQSSQQTKIADSLKAGRP